MKRYNITVNGKAYDVAVEELDAGAAPAASAAAAPAPAAPAASAEPAAAGTDEEDPFDKIFSIFNHK